MVKTQSFDSSFLSFYMEVNQTRFAESCDSKIRHQITSSFYPQNSTFALEASLLGQVFIFGTISQPRTLLKGLGPLHSYPEICEIKTQFFLRIRLASTRIQHIFRPYPEIFENALQSGIFFIRYEYVYVWTVISANFRIRLRHSLGSSLHGEH